jgi:hypothetical protein
MWQDVACKQVTLGGVGIAGQDESIDPFGLIGA